MNLDNAINSRKSIRKFKNKSVKWDKIMECVDSALQAPFAGNENHLKFIIVEDSETINDIATNCQQSWISDAPAIVIVCSDKTHLKAMYDEHAERYAEQQTGAAIQNFLLKITDLGLASCWVGAFAENQLKRSMKIPAEIEIEAVLPIGHELGNAKKVKKKTLESSVYWEKWKTSKRPIGLHDPTTRD